MADVQHSALTDPELHEPKGASSATSEQFYVADGIGSGAWEYQNFVLNAVIDDISTAGSFWVVSPYAGTIEKIYTVINSPITLADATLSFEIGGTPVTSGGITIAFTGSAAGDIDSSTPSANNAVTAGQAIELITDGGSTDPCKVEVTLLMKRTS